VAPNVRVEGSVFSDIRYHRLGVLLGTSHFDALGRMAWLWHFCTERQAEVLDEGLVACVVPPDHLVSAALGERVQGGIRIKGTRERIHWYGKLKESGKKGADARWHGHPMGSPSQRDGRTKEEEEVKAKEEVSSAGEEGCGEKGVGKTRKTPLPDDWEPTAAHAELAVKQGVDLPEQAARFRDWAHAKDARYARWDSAFSNWLRRSKEYTRQQRDGPPPVRDRARELWEWADRLEAERKAGGG